MEKILYFYPVHSSFVQSDNRLLANHYRVKSFYFKTAKKVLTPYYFITQSLFLLGHIFSASRLVSHFSGYHSFLPALAGMIFKKPHFIILNGTECNNFPEYNYGYLSHRLLYWFSKKSLQWSAKLLPASEALVSATYTFTPTQYTQQGFLHFYKGLQTPYEVIHNGISFEKFKLDTNIVRPPNTFITIATGLESSRVRSIKGLDLVIELANLHPEYVFTFIGGSTPEGIELPPNILVKGFVPNDELSAYYNSNAFYLQLSVSEGFGIAVCEAMLCGCIPVVSNVGILPMIAGPAGYILHQKNVSMLDSLVKQAIAEYNPARTTQVRQHILDHFSLEAREKKLVQALQTVKA